MRNYYNLDGARVIPQADCDSADAVFEGGTSAAGRIFAEAREENDDCVGGGGTGGTGGGGGGTTGSPDDFGCAGGYYCSDPTALNFQELEDVQVEGGQTCVDNSLCEFLDVEDDGSVVVVEGTNPIYGCTDISALNYDIQAQYDDGSCEYAPVDEEDPFDEEPDPQIEGCTNPTALNYDPSATIGSDALCEFEQEPEAVNYTTIFVAGGAAILLLLALRKR
tara:strand:+ start:451 stop:1113 length:663 start_codon:yes stop_codon:yes gene_type:complete